MFPRPPLPWPKGKKDLALLLAGGAVMGGKYLWNKFRERKNMKNSQPYKNFPTSSSAAPDGEFSFGSMESSSGGEISLKSVSVNGSIEGLLFSSTIRQEYRNETDEPLEIIYTFPLGWNTALLGMNALIGDKRLHGEIAKKAAAEEKYEDAIEKGDAAIMLQKSSLGLYTANLGNIRPGETVSVELHCARLLAYDQGQIRLAIPTVIGERYGDEHCEGGLASHETARVDPGARYAFDLSISIYGDMGKAEVECPSHNVEIEELVNGKVVSLAPGACLDRDFVLLVRGLAGESRALCAPDQDKWMEAAGFCPKIENVDDNPLGLKILVDCSGSMSGMSIAQARKGLQKILKLLAPQDFVSYSRFGSDVEHLANSMLGCDEANLKRLFAAIDATDADMGGTEMEKAVLAVIDDVKDAGDAPSVMMLITDGDIWEAQSLIESAKKSGHRIFVIGVGAAPAESVLMTLAEQTGGVCEFVTPNEDMAEAIVRMFHRMRGKAAKNIEVKWDRKPLWQSAPPKYVYDGETAHVFALFSEKPQSGPTLSWECGSEKHKEAIAGVEETDNTDLVRLGRKVQMEECATESEKVDLALKYELVCDLTSLILVHERAEDEKTQGVPKIQQVPQMPAYGHGCNKLAFRTLAQAGAFAVSNLCVMNYMGMEEDTSAQEELDGLSGNLRTLWNGHLYRNMMNSLADFIAAAERQPENQKLIAVIKKAAAGTGASCETVWAVFMRMILDKYNNLDRQSLRLLKPYLPAESEDSEILDRILEEYGRI